VDHSTREEIISGPFFLHLTDAAEADLAEIWLHLATEASPETASRFVEAVATACEPLRQFPLSGAPRPHLAPGLRVIFHYPYAIYYTPTAELRPS
jgi:toxin ParE1/3/4